MRKMLTSKMDDDKIMQRYAEYKQRLAESQQTKATAQAETDAFWQAKKDLACKPVTVRKPHVCCECKRIIMVGEQATVKAEFGNIATGAGYTPGFQSFYTCSNCKPITKEA